ncbi:RHS repeat-associated protein [Paenibacillus sp. JGP012]|nr:RHS repeat-associated protein [Paenibacillus sp. JGP012]
MDANGNLLYATDGSTASAYEYDARNRLVKAAKLKYRYNPQGDRIELAQRGQVTRYVIDDAPELSRVTDRYTYGLYGELEQHEGVTSQPFAYNGRDGVMTDANGLYYMRARYYDPKLKRFLNRDVIRGEIEDGQTFNRYAYVNGNPVSYIDPLGLMKCENEHYVRYGAEKEAKDSLDAKGLLPKVHDNGTESRGSKWISEKGKERDPRYLGDPENYTQKIKIETKKGTKEWLQSKGVDFEAMVGGESKYTNRVIIKSSNEAGSYGIGSGLLKEFNEKWVEKITIEKVPSSKKKGR